MNKTAIITGASTGIGHALSLELAGLGYDLGLMARQEPLLLALQQEIKQQFPERRIFISRCDVTDFETLRQCILDLANKLGRLDLFIANAGIGVSTPAWKNNWETIRQILNINVMGAIASLEAAKEIMLGQKFGHLVGISSVAGFRGLPGSSAYCTSKAALTTYLESIRVDLKYFGIPVTSIHPGYIATPMTEKNKIMPFLLSAPVGAKKIVNAIHAKKSRYIFPWQLRLLIPILRHIPDWFYDFVMSLRGKKGVFE